MHPNSLGQIPVFCWLNPFESKFSMEKSLLGTRPLPRLWLQLRELSKSLGRQIFQRCQDPRFRSAWAGGDLPETAIVSTSPGYRHTIHIIYIYMYIYLWQLMIIINDVIHILMMIIHDHILYVMYDICIYTMWSLIIIINHSSCSIPMRTLSRFILHSRVWLPKGNASSGTNGESSQTCVVSELLKSNVSQIWNTKKHETHTI